MLFNKFIMFNCNMLFEAPSPMSQLMREYGTHWSWLKHKHELSRLHITQKTNKYNRKWTWNDSPGFWNTSTIILVKCQCLYWSSFFKIPHCLQISASLATPFSKIVYTVVLNFATRAQILLSDWSVDKSQFYFFVTNYYQRSEGFILHEIKKEKY